MRRWSIALVAALMLAAVATIVLASHDWIQTWKKLNVGYGYVISAYTDSDSNNDRHSPWKADFEYADFWLAYTAFGNPVAYRTATCSGADACERTETNTYLAPNGTHFWLRSMHCGKDVVGSVTHLAATNDQNLGPCSSEGISQYIRYLQWDF